MGFSKFCRIDINMILQIDVPSEIKIKQYNAMVFYEMGFSKLLKNKKIGVTDEIPNDSYAVDIFYRAFSFGTFESCTSTCTNMYHSLPELNLV